jgi:hypothetical protein
LPPALVFAIPTNRLGQSRFERFSGAPPEFGLNFCGIYGIAAIVPRPVSHIGDETATRSSRGRLYLIKQIANGVDKVDAPYCPENEIVVRWDDPGSTIDWGIDRPIMSVKDNAAPLLADIKSLE